jgi:chromosome segregation ATPase
MATTSNTNGLRDESQASVDADIAELASLIHNELNEETADNSLPEVLRQLDRADNMARSMESRLDDLLGNLDQLLNGLEEAQTRREVQNTSVPVEPDGRKTETPQSQRKPPEDTS